MKGTLSTFRISGSKFENFEKSTVTVFRQGPIYCVCNMLYDVFVHTGCNCKVSEVLWCPGAIFGSGCLLVKRKWYDTQTPFALVKASEETPIESVQSPPRNLFYVAFHASICNWKMWKRRNSHWKALARVCVSSQDVYTLIPGNGFDHVWCVKCTWKNGAVFVFF